MAQQRIQDFSGGETDRFRDGPPNSYVLARNMYVNTRRKLESRPGYNAFSFLIGGASPFGTQDVEMLWHHFTQQGSSDREYFSFIASNRAAKSAPDDSGAWSNIQAAGAGPGDFTFLDINRQEYQWNYIRISDSEFLVTQNFGYPIKFYRTGSTTWTAVSLGLPQYNGSNTFPSPVLDGAANGNYVWALVLKHTYTVFDPSGISITKTVRGAPFFSRAYANVRGPSGADPATINLADIFTSATLTDNRFLNSIPSRDLFHPDTVWEVYRTKDDGGIFYYVGEETADGTNFIDDQEDSDIESNEILYTTGGVEPNEMTQSSVFAGTVANDTLWLASSGRVWQSKVGIYDAVPGSFVFDVREGETITSLQTIDIYPIVFTNLGVYRIEGIVDDLGNGTHRVRTVSGAETKGALSHKTTVKANNSIFYWGYDGVYETNGYTAKKVSSHYEEFYKEIFETVALNDSDQDTPAYKLAHGCWERTSDRIHWFYPAPGEKKLTKTFTIDTEYANPEGGYCKTSGDVPYNVSACASPDDNIHISTSNGQVLRQYPGRTLDLDPGSNTSSSVEGPAIEWDYISCSMSFGSDFIRKWFTRLLFNFTNLTRLTFSIFSDTDESNDYRAHNPIVRKETSRGFHYFKRGFPKGRLRGAYKQIRATNSVPLPIYESDNLGGITIAGDMVSLDAGTWPIDIHGGGSYFLNLDAGTYQIRSISSDSSPFAPTSSFLLETGSGAPGGPQTDWFISAVPNDEAVELNSYSIDFISSGEGHTQSGVEGVAND